MEVGSEAAQWKLQPLEKLQIHPAMKQKETYGFHVNWSFHFCDSQCMCRALTMPALAAACNMGGNDGPRVRRRMVSPPIMFYGWGGDDAVHRSTPHSAEHKQRNQNGAHNKGLRKGITHHAVALDFHLLLTLKLELELEGLQLQQELQLEPERELELERLQLLQQVTHLPHPP